MKTTNLVQFSIVCPQDNADAEEVVVFALIDIGILNPPRDGRMDTSLELFRIVGAVINKNKKK